MSTTVQQAIRLRGVSRVFRRNEGDVEALQNVDLDVDVAEALAITGPSGSGKSTLLALIAGMDHPTAGEIVVLDHVLTTMNEDERADLRRQKMGFVFQNYHLLPTLTVCENVMLPLIPVEGNSLQLKAKALHCIERVGLEKRINHLPGELSGGEQQRAGLARALIAEPKLILADEPTGNLDAESAKVILDLLFDLVTQRQCTVVLTTHNETTAQRCRKRIRLVDGRITE